jgi:hypothetical protein
MTEPFIAKPANTTRKEEILETIRKAARELGHAPTRQEFMRATGMHYCKLIPYFAGFRAAVREAGLAPHPAGVRIDTAAMLKDWGGLARKLGRVPTREEYERRGQYAAASLEARFRRWGEVHTSFIEVMQRGGLEEAWADVAELIRKGPLPKRGGGKSWLKKPNCVRQIGTGESAQKLIGTGEQNRKQDLAANFVEPDGSSSGTPVTILPPPLWGKKRVPPEMMLLVLEGARVRDGDAAQNSQGWGMARRDSGFRFGRLAPLAAGVRRVFPGRPLMGPALALPGLAHEPVNEMEVVFLFAMLAADLGFIVESVQMSFPDCEAMLEVEPGRWQRLRIEFEYESRKFRDHHHDAKQCDLIVCWRHNWPGCPKELRVLELQEVVRRMGK